LELGHIVDKYGDVPANQSFLQADDVEVVNPGSEDSLPVGTASIKSKVISNVESEAPLSMDVPADRVTVYEMEVDEAVLNVPPTTPAAIINHPPTPPSPDDYRHARAQRRGHMLDKSIPLLVSQEIQKQAEEEEPEPSNPFPLATFLTDTTFLSSLLSYLTFYEWCILSSVSKDIRTMLGDNGNLREEVLERYLRTVGYARWSWGELEPLTLTLQVSLFFH
jgi:hypothetical protein